MHAGWRSMCGVIVVDAGRSRSTNLGHDAYILITSLDIVITIRFSINCPTVISLPTVCYFLREATSEICGPRVYSLSYLLWDLFLFAFVFRSIIPKTQKYFVAYFISIFYLSSIYPIYHKFYPVNLTISGAVTRGGIDNPLYAGLQVFIICV